MKVFKRVAELAFLAIVFVLGAILVSVVAVIAYCRLSYRRINEQMQQQENRGQDKKQSQTSDRWVKEQEQTNISIPKYERDADGTLKGPWKRRVG